MAQKKTARRKTSYIDPNLMNDFSGAFNDALYPVMLGESDIAEARLSVYEAWYDIQTGLAKKASPKMIQDLDEKINSLMALDTMELFHQGNKLIDCHRRQSDASKSMARNETILFWIKSASEDTKDWDLPWIRKMQVAEKLLPFVQSNERYIFTGRANQIILLMALEQERQNRDAARDLEPVVLFMGDVRKIVELSMISEAGAEEVSEEAVKSRVREIMKGTKSLTSIFVKTSRKSYVYEDGAPFRKSKEQKYPTKAQLDSGEVRKTETTAFISQPVWLAQDLLERLPKVAQEKFDELLEARVVNKRNLELYKPEADTMDLDTYIDQTIKQKIGQMAIVAEEGGDKAMYLPLQDEIAVPPKSAFFNPIERFATVMHELAHSTKHLLKRPSTSEFGSVQYAKEEIVAETTAMLMTQELEEQMTEGRGGELPADWKARFTDYYRNSEGYSNHWGGEFDFKGMLGDIFAQKNEDQRLNAGAKVDIFDTLIEQTLGAYQVLRTGGLNGQEITPELRGAALTEAFGLNRSPEAIDEPDPLAP